MPSILDRIVADTRRLVERRRRETPEEALRDRPLFERQTLDFVEPLSRTGLQVIAEAKKASPSEGVIRASYDAGQLAQQYHQAGAAAVSVLTEPLHFQGALAHLAWTRALNPDVPLLRKDFVVHPYQLVEAKAFGADAVLLLAGLHEAPALAELHDMATDLGLTPLVEVYDEQELDRIDFAQVQVVGANSRDLRTFEIDLARVPRLLAYVPEDVVRVAESGVHTAEDLAFLADHDLDAALVGTTLVRADDPGAKLRELLEGARAFA